MDKKTGGSRLGRKEIRRDGVIYTPSRESRGPQETRTLPPDIRRPASRPPSRRGKKRSGFALFFIVTVFVGVLACVLVFAFMFRSVLNKGGGAAAVNTPEPTFNFAPASAAPMAEGQITAVGLVTMVDGVGRTVSLRDLNQDKRYTLTVATGTDLRDKYGNPLVFAELAAGDVVEAAFPAAGGAAASLKISPQAREFKDVSGAKVDDGAQTVAIGNETFTYDDTLLCVYKNAEFDISALDAIDVATFRCYKEQLLYVGVAKRSGTLVLEEYPNITDGTMEIDTAQFIALGEGRELRVTEGRHRIVVQGANIEPFVTEMTVDAGEKYRVDLSEIVMKTGLVTFVMNETGAMVTLNGREIDPAEPSLLPYGEYAVRAEKEGFAPFEAAFKLNGPAYTVAVTLAAAPTPTPPAVPTAKLSILSDPDGALVFVDGQLAGQAPVTLPVAYGSHTVTVKMTGYITIDIPLDVNMDNLSRLIILQPE